VRLPHPPRAVDVPHPTRATTHVNWVLRRENDYVSYHILFPHASQWLSLFENC